MRKLDDILMRQFEIQAEMRAMAERRRQRAREYRGPWLGEYKDPRCEEVVTLVYGRVVRVWKNPALG